MASPSKPSGPSLKRKHEAAVSSSRRVHKVARVGCEDESSSQSSSHSCLSCASRPLLSETCHNYLNSGVPCRIMFYIRHAWRNFPNSVTQMLINGFKDEKPSMKFSVGDTSFIFDFLSMAVVNLKTRKQKAIAWIDEAERCFFPAVFGQDADDDCDEWDFGITNSEVVKMPSHPEVVKHVIEESSPTVSEPLTTKLHALRRDSEGFCFAQNMFLSGMRPFAKPDNILAIHRYDPKGISGKNMRERFEAQVRERGDANVQYGWFGARKSNLAEVLSHGFAAIGQKVTEEGPLGTALYLTRENRSFASVKLCDVDEKGRQFMILCRVILSNTEEVELGSKQNLPSSGDYDSGVDNCSTPNCYVVWPTRLRTYVHPEYLVTFRLTSSSRDYLLELQDMRFPVGKTLNVSDTSTPNSASKESARPTSPWVTFPLILKEIQDKVSPIVWELLVLHHQEFKNKVLSRDEFVKRMKDMVGNQTMAAALLKLQRDPSSWSVGCAAKTTKESVDIKAEKGGSTSREVNCPTNTQTRA